jgi:hypothetical protein
VLELALRHRKNAFRVVLIQFKKLVAGFPSSPFLHYLQHRWRRDFCTQFPIL